MTKKTKVMKQIDELFNQTPNVNQSVWSMLYFGCLEIFFDNKLHKNMSNEQIEKFCDGDIKAALTTKAEYWDEYKPLVIKAFERIL